MYVKTLANFIFLLFHVFVSAKRTKVDPACSVDNMRAYTGIKIQQEWAVNRTSLLNSLLLDRHTPQLKSEESKLLLIVCCDGVIQGQVRMNSSASVFNTTHCVEPNQESQATECYHFARRNIYVTHLRNKFIPGSLIGGVFYSKYPENPLFDWKPYRPLIADKWDSWYIKTSRRQVVLRLTKFRTAEVLDKAFSQTNAWASSINVYEHY